MVSLNDQDVDAISIILKHMDVKDIANLALSSSYQQQNVNKHRQRMIRFQKQLWSFCFPEIINSNDYNVNENILHKMGASTF